MPRRLQVMVEYVVLVAVALLVVGIVSYLVLDIRGVEGVKERQSRLYWESSAPFSIINYKSEDNTLSFEIKNNDPQALTITGFYIDEQKYTIYDVRTNGETIVTNNVTIPPGRTVMFDGIGTGECENRFTYTMDIEYAKSSLEEIRQVGEEPLRGSCGKTTSCISLVLLGC